MINDDNNFRFCGTSISVGGSVFLVLRALDLRLNGRQFDPWPLHYRLAGTGIGDRPFSGGIPP